MKLSNLARGKLCVYIDLESGNLILSEFLA